MSVCEATHTLSQLAPDACVWPVPITPVPSHSLSVTKWIHLQRGDTGIQQLFTKIHALLRPGGVLVCGVCLEGRRATTGIIACSRAPPWNCITLRTLADDFIPFLMRFASSDPGAAALEVIQEEMQTDPSECTSCPPRLCTLHILKASVCRLLAS